MNESKWKDSPQLTGHGEMNGEYMNNVNCKNKLRKWTFAYARLFENSRFFVSLQVVVLVHSLSVDSFRVTKLWRASALFSFL